MDRKAIFLIPFTFIMLLIFVYRSPDPFVAYRHHLSDPVSHHVVKAIESMKNPEKGDVAINIGLGVGSESLLLLQKGFDVIGVDVARTALRFVQERSDIGAFGDRFRAIWGPPSMVYLKDIHELSVVIVDPSIYIEWTYDSNLFWSPLIDKIKPGGYFIGRAMDSVYVDLKSHDIKNIPSLTKEDVLRQFQKFEILWFQEISSGDIGGRVYKTYEIVARKL